MDAAISKAVDVWLAEPSIDEAHKKEIRELVADGNEKELTDRFYRELEFGTGGMLPLFNAIPVILAGNSFDAKGVKKVLPKTQVVIEMERGRNPDGQIPSGSRRGRGRERPFPLAQRGSSFRRRGCHPFMVRTLFLESTPIFVKSRFSSVLSVCSLKIFSYGIVCPPST